MPPLTHDEIETARVAIRDVLARGLTLQPDEVVDAAKLDLMAKHRFFPVTAARAAAKAWAQHFTVYGGA